MPSSDITADFRKIIQEKESQIPDAKRRKLASKSTRNESGREGQAHVSKEYITEAYVIVSQASANSSEFSKIYLSL